MNLPTITIQEMIEAGVHYGHKTMRWNPKMAPYIYSTHNDIHIMDLQKILPMLGSALTAIYNTVKSHGRVLFVGTKIQAGAIIAEEAKRCGQYYVNHRWLGGMLTNFSTVAESIKRLESMEEKLSSERALEEAQATLADTDAEGETPSAPISKMRFTKKELLEVKRKAEKLERSLGGIRNMGGRPDILFVMDTNKESLAIKEAQRLGIPVVAILDSNSNPDGIDYIVPGNDDAIRSIRLFCRLVADAVLAGIQDSMVASGVDMGTLEEGFADVFASGAGKKEGQKPVAKKASKAVGVHAKKHAPITKVEKPLENGVDEVSAGNEAEAVLESADLSVPSTPESVAETGEADTVSSES